jgi:DNA-binding PadR family transcriptional regulator
MENERQFSPRGLTLLVLEQVDKLGMDACGTEIHKVLDGKVGYKNKSQVYVALNRLYWKGLIQPAKAHKVRAGARKFYTLTVLGKMKLVDSGGLQ